LEELGVALVAFDRADERFKDAAEMGGGGDAYGVGRGLLEGNEAGLNSGRGDEFEKVQEGEVGRAGEVGEGETGSEKGVKERPLLIGGRGSGRCQHGGSVRYLKGVAIGFCTIFASIL